MLICWLVLDFHYSSEKVTVVCRSDVTGGYFKCSFNGV